MKTYSLPFDKDPPELATDDPEPPNLSELELQALIEQTRDELSERLTWPNGVATLVRWALHGLETA